MNRRYFEGEVVSNKMQKTVVVAVNVPSKHPIYQKAIKVTKRFIVRNELEAKLGDRVAIEETRPLSSKSTWHIIKVLESSKRKK